jgi:hypothetical protein
MNPIVRNNFLLTRWTRSDPLDTLDKGLRKTAVQVAAASTPQR